MSAPTRIRLAPFPPPMAESYGALRLRESRARSSTRDEAPEPSQQERCGEARQRGREGDVAGVSVLDEIRPPVRPDGRQPLVEPEADEPGGDLLHAHRRRSEHVL